MSGFLFLLSIDWVMNRTTEGRRTGIRWKLTSVLEDLDFADNIALLSSRCVDIEEKTSRLVDETARVGLKINAMKSKVMRIRKQEDESSIVQNNFQSSFDVWLRSLETHENRSKEAGHFPIQMHETHTENKMATDHLAPTNPGDHRSEQNK